MENSVRVLVGPLPVDTMNCVSVERSDWTGCTENKVGSGPKLIVRGVAPLRRSVLFNTQYWTPRYDGFPPVHEEKSFAEMMTTRLLKPRSGWSAQPVIVETLYAFHRPAGSSDLETSSRTLPVVTSVIEVNQRPLAVSKWTFGSLMKSVDGTPKNVSSGKVCTSTPCFVEIRPRTFTISTTWFGTTATWTAGGVRRFVYGPFVPKWRPSKDSTGTEAPGVGPADPVWVGRIPRSPGVTMESRLDADETTGSCGKAVRPGLSASGRDAIGKVHADETTAKPATKSATTRMHGWWDATRVER